MKQRLVVSSLILFAVSGAAFAAERSADSEGFVSLFDGRTLDGWVQRGGQAKYEVVDGAIEGTTVPKTPNSFLCTDRDYANFILELEFKVDDGLNSGIQVRSQCFDEPKTLDWNGKQIKIAAGRVHGYQVEIDTNDRAWSGGIYDEGRRGWLNDLKDNDAARKAFKHNEWNKYRIECNGDSIKTWINDVAAADLKDDMTPSGFIALQVHGTKSETPLHVWWRNIRIKTLP
ncbi:MAG TPA: DUF1080 domain-containing protein [Pirellulales bacterium]|jgi:hypothetical protein|nr:DUF1080 domain-containing protein [Pirellulales bacterium]